MKYLVMENHESHSIVMDENGLFHRVANLGYEIGETITEPIFMKTPERKKKTDWKKISTIAAIFVCMLLGTIPFISNNAESDVVVYMSINPEIHLELNEDGKINKLIADNDDGKILLDGYKYKGKNVSEVLIELIKRADQLKYLSEGGDIHIAVKAEDKTKAKIVEVDLSENLNDTFVKKYLIKIKANEEVYRELDEVLSSKGYMEYSETTEAVSESVTADNYKNMDNYNKTTTQASEGSTESTTTNQKPAIKPTEKPTGSPTNPAEPPTEAATQPASENETPTSEQEDSDEDADEDVYWPWWPNSI